MQISIQLPDAIAENFMQTVPENMRSHIVSELLGEYLQQNQTQAALLDKIQRQKKRQELLDNLPPMTKKYSAIFGANEGALSDADIEAARAAYLLNK